MKITVSELRKIIKEELESPIAYKRWKELRDIHGMSADDKISSAVSYGYFENDLEKLFELKSSSSGYYDFFSRVKNENLNYPAQRISDFYHSSFNSVEELERAVKQIKIIRDRFKVEEVTSETDRMYGRKSYKVIDTLTGDVVDHYRDREGRL